VKCVEFEMIVRILPPPRAWIVARPGHARPQCFDDSRDSKNDSNLGARREIQRRRRHAPSCMGATELQSNWPEMRKTLGKPGFCSGEDRNRTTYKFPGKLALRHHARREIRRAPRNRQRARQRTSDGFRIQVTAFGTALFEMKRSRHILPLLSTF
jgi:hypothetical protein